MTIALFGGACNLALTKGAPERVQKKFIDLFRAAISVVLLSKAELVCFTVVAVLLVMNGAA